MRSRRVPVLRLGSRGPGGEARSLRLWSQAFASVRNRPPSTAILRKRSRSVGLVLDLRRTCRRRKSSRNAELSSLFTFRITKVSTVTGIGGVVVAKPRTVRHFWTRLASSRLKSVNSHRDRGGGGRETSTVVTFGLVLRLRVSKVSTVTGIGGVVVAKPRLSSLLDSSCVFASQKCQQSQGSGVVVAKPRLSSPLDSSRLFASGIGGVVVAKPRTVRHFWTRLASSRLKSVNSHRDRGGGGRETSTVVTFGLVLRLRVSKVSTVTGIGGVVVAKPRPRTVVTFGLVSGLRVSKMSTVTGIGGSWSRNPELSLILD